MTITGQQCRAARILAGVDMALLADTSGVATDAIASFEDDGTPPTVGVEALRHALERLGIEFILEDDTGGAGVRLKFDSAQNRRISAWEAEGGAAAEDDIP